MMKPLRFDKRIELHEKTDIFKVKTIELPSKEHPQLLRGRSDKPREDGREERPEEDNSIVCIKIPDIIVADVSFISLKKVLSYAKNHLSNQQTNFLVMLKPQFEARPDQLNKGIIKNEKIRRNVIKDFEQWLKNNQFIIVKKRDNTLEGKYGNLERFYWLQKTD